MPLKKTKHTQITSERVRKSTLKRRLDGLFKKAKELSILCEVEIVIIIHDPNDGNSTLWPSQDRAVEGIMKFSTIPERERLKKMVLQEKFLMAKVQDMAEKLSKLQKENEETDMGLLMNQLIDGKTFNELDARQLNGLYHLVDEKLKKLQNRNHELDQVPRQLSEIDISHHDHPCVQIAGATTARKDPNNGMFARPSITTLMEEVQEIKWFNEARIPNNLDFWKASGIEAESTEVATSFIEGNQSKLRDEFNQVWPTILSP